MSLEPHARNEGDECSIVVRRLDFRAERLASNELEHSWRLHELEDRSLAFR
jgi:hypothetical protein